MENAREWLQTDETAKEMLTRVLRERPPLLVPPLHRLSLRAGNVVEIVGPSPSAKTQILMQVAVNHILPREWKGVFYGGLERPVMFIDMDCGFDISRLLQLIKHRITEAGGSIGDEKPASRHGRARSCSINRASRGEYDEELIEMCLRRFLHVRCYDSFEFLAILKTLRYQLQMAKDQLGTDVHCLMIDSIAAYYWVDRASTSYTFGASNRNTLSLQSVTEAVVRELKELLQDQPMLILATKATIFGDTSFNTGRSLNKSFEQDKVGQSSLNGNTPSVSHREYMPPAWQSFITHRIFIHPVDSDLSTGSGHIKEQVYLAEWLLPFLDYRDKFVVKDGKDVVGRISSDLTEQVHQDEALAPELQPQMEPIHGSQERAFTVLETSESDEDEAQSSSSEYNDDTSFFASSEFDPELEFLEGEEEFSDEMEEDDIDPDELSYEELLELGEAVGKENRGLAPEDIRLALFPYFRPSFEYRNSIDRCVVCQMEYDEREELVVLQCEHPFHSDCISQWLQIRKICPICSMEITQTKRSNRTTI